MQFLAPIMLAGAAAVSIPIALHFFYRIRYKPVPWAAMRFLKEAIEQTSRRLKFQEWILLALRCLAIVLLALAMARPGMHSATTAGRGQAIDAVFVFDTSYSMAAIDSEGGKTRLDKAKQGALAVLDTLPSNSTIQIYGCADRAYFLGPLVRSNLDQARTLISSIEVTSLSTDLLPGLSQAFAAAKEGNAPAKEIYVFTDMQKSGFERQQGTIKAKCEEIAQAANLVFVRCGRPDRQLANVAILEVSIVSDIPHTRSRIPFEVKLKNTGSQEAKNLQVSVVLDGKAIEKSAVKIDRIEAGQIYTATVTGSLDEPGARILAVELTGDDVPGDNVLYKMIYVRDKIRVLLVDGTPNPDNPLESGDHFVNTVLNPGRIPEFFIETDTISASDVGPLQLDNKDIVYLLNAPIRDADPLAGLSSEFLSRLGDFVRNGGGLIIGCGDKVNPVLYNKVLGKAGAQLLPFDLTSVRNTTEESPFFPAPESIEEPSFLQPLRKSPYSDVFRYLEITKILDVDESSPGGRVLLRTTDAKPLLTSKLVGEGEVFFLGTSLDTQWGKFPTDGRIFVPFTRYALVELTNRKAPGGTLQAGNPLVAFVPDNATPFDLVKPPKPGESLRPRVKLDASPAAPGQRSTVTTNDTLRAGIYRVVPAGRPDDEGPVFAVNPDLRETEDLATASDADVRNWLGYNVPIVDAGAGTAAAVDEVRTQSEWTVWFLAILLAVLIGEAVWAWYCGRAI